MPAVPQPSNNMTPRQLLSFCLAFPMVLAFGQKTVPKGFDPKIPLLELSMDSWTNKNGLISNNVNAVFQSSDEFLWIASYSGLHRFDGYEFESFDLTVLDFLHSQGISGIAELPNGPVVFSTQSSGLFQHDGLAFSPMEINQLIPRAIATIYTDSKGNLWIGSENNGLYQYAPPEKVTKITQIPSVTITKIIEDHDGNIWVGTDGQGAFRMRPDGVENFTVKSGLSHNIVNALAVTTDNLVFIGGLNGLDMVRNQSISSIPSLQRTFVNDLIPDDYGYLWIASDKGLFRMAPDRLMENLSESNGLPGNRLSSIQFDQEGSLWVGTYETGLIRFKSSMVRNITTRHGLSTNQIYSVGKHDEKYFIGTQDGKVMVLDGTTMSQLTLPKEFQEDAIRDFLFEKDALWISNYMGLIKISKNKIQYFNESNGLPTNSIRRLFRSSNGTLWLATRSGGLVKFDENGNHQIFDKNRGLLTNYVMSINEDTDGNILIGTNVGGLSTLTPSGVIENFRIKDDDTGTIIFSIVPGEKNTAWLCTNFGLYLFDKGLLKKIELESGLPSENFFDFLDTYHGSYWITTNFGVLKILKSDLQNFIQNKIPAVPYKLYNEEDGMVSHECTGGVKSYFDNETGTIWIPTRGGMVVLDPAREIANSKPPKVIITRVQVDNSPIYPVVNNLIVQPGTFRYTFDVTALSFMAPSKVKFKYKLEGIESEWNGPTNKRRVEYTNLPYGAYTLRVIACNSDGVWNTEGAVLTFIVKPFYFETWWFKSGILLFFALILYSVYRWRINDIKKHNRALKKMNIELDKFVYSASHDLRGPLTSAMGILNLALVSNDKSSKEYFDLIKANLDKMDHAIRELIHYAKNKNDEIVLTQLHARTLVNEVIEEMKAYNFSREIDFKLDIPESMTFRGDEARLKVILKNLIHNAVTFSNGQHEKVPVEIRIDNLDGKTRICIKDQGIGIEDNILPNIFNMFYRGSTLSAGSGLGLYVVKDTCEKLGAQVDVRSRPGKGSEFWVILS
jgi:signal transduction histidine kinase/ligand-binding sensor domain-containing protein